MSDASQKDEIRWFEKKRLAEKIRREKIRQNPEEYEKFKKARRDIYYRRKAENKIVPTNQLPQCEQEALQERNKIACKKYRAKHRPTPKHQTAPLIDTHLLPNTGDALDNSSTQLEQVQCKLENTVRVINQDTGLRSNDTSVRPQHKIVPANQLSQCEEEALQERNKIACKKYRAKHRPTPKPQTASLIDTDMLPNIRDTLDNSSTQLEQVQCKLENTVRVIHQDTDLTSNDTSVRPQQPTSSRTFKKKHVHSAPHAGS